MSMRKGQRCSAWVVRDDGKYKRCSRKDCRFGGQMLHESMFVLKAGAPNGLTSECKVCHSNDASRWAAQHPERVSEIQKRAVSKRKARERTERNLGRSMRWLIEDLNMSEREVGVNDQAA